MRVKDVWEILPLRAKIKLFWDRITLTKTTTVYFVFSVLHCVVQAQAFQINVQAADFLASITEQGNATDSDAFYVLGNDLRLCDNDGMVENNTLISTSAVVAMVVNETVDPSPAKTTSSISGTSTISVISSRPSSAPTTGITGMTVQSHPTTTTRIGSNSTNSPQSSHPSSTSISATTKQAKIVNRRIQSANFNLKRSFPSITVEINGTAQVVVNSLGWNDQSAILDRECLWALGWPVQILRNTKREDLAFIMFQIWVLGMSIVAILNESVPHTIASLLTHLVATGWAGFQIFNTTQFRSDFAAVATKGACHPINLLPTYWQSRSAAEIPSLLLNAVALLVSAFLSWGLGKAFGWQTFKRVGASLTISRVYKIVLTLSIVIQLSLFFIVT
ncbi:hypothetical protein OG21DRAFT_1480717 [Imleria badia]|nr:hypothetical protein OG21DRAFT_1480717 [Imleria badia]